MFPVASNSNVRTADVFMKQVPLCRGKGKQSILPEGVWDIVRKRWEVPKSLGRECGFRSHLSWRNMGVFYSPARGLEELIHYPP